MNEVNEVLEQTAGGQYIFNLKQRGVKTIRKLLPEAIQKLIDQSMPPQLVTILTSDYQVDFHNDWSGELSPELRIQSRGLRTEWYKGKTVRELAEYAAKRITRRGLARLFLETLPNAISYALDRSDDFFDYHITEPVRAFLR